MAIDVSEASVLLQARGDDLADLVSTAGRIRDAGLEASGRPGVIGVEPETGAVYFVMPDGEA